MSPAAEAVSSTPDHKLRRVVRYRSVWLGLACGLAVAAVLRWGARLLISTDPLPSSVDVAIVLQGSIAGETARTHDAMRLLAEGRTKRVALSVPRESYWGEAVAPSARRYIEKNYGSQLVREVDFCETGPGVNSTEQEAAALLPCIEQQGWRRVVIVTSNYHSRRAGLIWRKAVRHDAPGLRLWIEGAPDPDFHPEGWWRERLSAKTWYLESTKLFWSFFFP